MTTEVSTNVAPSRAILRDQIRAWWGSILAGQIEGAHPIYGTDLSVALEGDALILTGAVSSTDDRIQIEREVDCLRGSGFTTIENHLVVKPGTDDHTGLLTQVLIASFETPDRAGFAARYLSEHAHVHPLALEILDPADAEAAEATLRARLPEPSWADARRALKVNRTLVLVTVDETKAFITRSALDEETRSLETVVLPPQPALRLAKDRGNPGRG